MASATDTQAAVNIYLGNLQVHLTGGIVEFRGVEVVEINTSKHRKINAILGRDILCRGANSFKMANGAYELCLEEPMAQVK